MSEFERRLKRGIEIYRKVTGEETRYSTELVVCGAWQGILYLYVSRPSIAKIRKVRVSLSELVGRDKLVPPDCPQYRTKIAIFIISYACEKNKFIQ